MGKETFKFIAGDDDYIVGRAAGDAWAKLSSGVTDELSREVLDGFAAKTDDVRAVVDLFRSAVQTLSLFGSDKVVWLRGVNFLSDTVVGRSEGTKACVEDLQAILGGVDPASTKVLISASPVDRRRREFKWFMKEGAGDDLKVAKDNSELAALLEKEAASLEVKIGRAALNALMGKVNGSARLAVEEVRKLATWLGKPGGTISEKDVISLVPDFGGDDFFEPVEAFYSLDVDWTLDALDRYFFNHSDARAILSSLQGRNRLLIQIRALIDGGVVRLGSRGMSSSDLEAAAGRFRHLYKDVAEVKSGFNVFSQNAWYITNKVAPPVKDLSLGVLIDWQENFFQAFRGLLSRATEQDSVMRELTMRCLGR